MDGSASIAKIGVMAIRENEFEPRLGKPPADHAPKLKGVRSAVRQAIHLRRASGSKSKQPAVRAHFAKGSKARARPVATAMRRVVVKVRYAANVGGGVAPLRAHVSYLSREGKVDAKASGVSVDDQPDDPTRSVKYLERGGISDRASLAFYDRSGDRLDARAVTSSWVDDARHFRMIVSAEDGAALGDLKPFIRELIDGFEARLGTRFEWLAVDHHDTDNPHTHVLIRGRRPDGQDLFIPSKLIASGVREQAQEIVTRVLGPRLEADLIKEQFNDIGRRAVTSLDRELLSAGRAGAFVPGRPDLVARLDRLERWGLAERHADGWRLDSDLASQLRSLALRDEIERVVASVRPDRAHLRLLEADQSSPATGELVHVGPVDELDDRLLAVIETGRGELRYARFERAQDLAVLAGAQPGAMVSVEPNIPELRPSDDAVARIAIQTGGVYSAAAHTELEPAADRRVIDANMRRLEAMRRAGLVQRTGRGDFLVGADHLTTAMTFEERLVARAPFSVRIISYWSLAEQIDAPGLTHLDKALAGLADAPAGDGRIAHAFEQALQQRRLYLIEQGWMREQERAPSALAMQQLAAAEIEHQAKQLAKELGVPVLAYEARRVSGVYARRIDLALGRMALILGERQANLVPWRPALERFAGREVEGVTRGQGLSWTLSRRFGIGLPPM
ncbi:MAG TPA: DUF3363 domain-containing protein [Hyphomonadaceae bacterium]|jgi:hypothetical protein|nr:DUF3363 domain-containing protein [Hyphomonadaceae bacterium]